jgi:hypothetical protein
MTRSIFLPGESLSDVQDSLNNAKSEDELKKLMSKRLHANGWDREKELSFREACRVIGYRLPGQKKPVESNLAEGSKTRVYLDALKHQRHHSHLIKDDMEGT